MNGSQETYLGDGLYARFDGWSIWLRASREGGDHVVALEPEVLHAFVQYIVRIKWRGRAQDRQP